jgi:hypothetical protein
MNRELLMLVEAISREKNVERDVVLVPSRPPGPGHQEAVRGEVDIRVSSIATAATTKPSAAGWWCPTMLACKTPTPKKC